VTCKSSPVNLKFNQWMYLHAIYHLKHESLNKYLYHESNYNSFLLINVYLIWFSYRSQLLSNWSAILIYELIINKSCRRRSTLCFQVTEVPMATLLATNSHFSPSFIYSLILSFEICSRIHFKVGFFRYSTVLAVNHYKSGIKKFVENNFCIK
jgi:hypothetical protein